MSVEVGQVLGNRYRIERLVGPSVMGTLYEGSDANTHRRVGISLLAPATYERRPGASREHEARAASRIGSQHLLEVLDIVGLLGGERCVVSEWLEGETLEARMSRLGTIPQTDLAPLVLQVLDGLAAAHRAGIVHRHLTPASVLILGSPAGQPELVKVVGFGVTRRLPDVDVPYYLAPEHLRSQHEVDARSNVFAIGVIMYRAVTGQPPWSAENAADLALKVSLHDPTPVEELAPELSPELARIILKAMARTPQARYPSAQEMLEAMVQWARGNFLTEALVVLQAPESAPTRPMPRARPAPRMPERPPAQPVSTRPRPVVERNPVIVAPVHRPRKPRSEEAPVDLVVISETPLSVARPARPARGTDPTMRVAAGWRRGRTALLWGSLLLLLLGVGTVLTQFGRGRLGESSLGPRPAAAASTPIAAKPAAPPRSDEALEAGGATKAAPEPSSTPQPVVQADVAEPSTARDDAPLVPARAAPTRGPASRSTSRPARATSATTASPTPRADSPKSSANPYAYR